MNSFLRSLAVLLAGSLLLISAPALAGKGFSDAEKKVIESYFAKNPVEGSKDMPKGMTNKLKRGGALPPGIKKTRLPTKLASKLPKRPKNQEYALIDDDIVLIDKKTEIIIDLLQDAAAGKR